MFYEFSGMGKYHINTMGENQDVIYHNRQDDCFVIALADGTSACKAARRGAEIASKALSELLLRERKAIFEPDRGLSAGVVVSTILNELKRVSACDGVELSEYASTVAGVLVDESAQKAYCVNMGDGIIFAAYSDRCRLLAMPETCAEGCYVTTTKNVASVLSQRVLDISEADSVMICSDGAWKHMYHRNRLKPEAVSLLVNRRYESLKLFLMSQDCFDDYSFIAADLPRVKKGNAA